MLRRLPRPPANEVSEKLLGLRPSSTRPLPCMFDCPARMKTFTLPLPGGGLTVWNKDGVGPLGAFVAFPG